MQVALDDYAWAAGVATELVNTTAEVWRGADRLPDAAALVDFADLHGGRSAHPGTGSALSALARRADAADLEAVRALRGPVRELIDHPDRDRLIAGGSALTGHGGATLAADPAHPDRTGWALRLRDGAGIAEALSLVCGIGILGTVRALGEERFRPCGAPTCRGAFIDTTRPGHRRYCMPGLCGNRVNVANHRARKASPPGPGGG
ncbi:CGNR zinc finger domain-containing protein [Nocardiopsis sp. RSe5-2]|uniref:CGNR zinc finger domain-containing protein n=1 Tax=Nocardiopsis endophytica TaxID=3018445 RepID=A0ABT4UBR5_9ACTN|nr:CGNR zinc finger domain-containing protein [Nocardiopsis endophytica]MDA2814419.1 CGNR zinc finger domain-containing protein [Nocardiopsis endophytica]